MSALGVIVGLSTAASWSACALFFTSASKRVGVMSMNHYRTLFGTILLLIAVFAVTGSPIPKASPTQTYLLIASGIIGVVIGDYFLFHSYVDIGPRLGLLIFNINPFLTAIVARTFLGEKLSGMAWIGIFVTVAGTLWVLWEENGSGGITRSRHHVRGVVFAALAALRQAFGYTIAKPALTGVGSMDALPATLIRVGAAVVGFWALGLLTGRTRKVLSDFKNKHAMLQVFGGAVTGPFIGIWLSLLALKLLPTGIAATLICTMPVMILPFVIIFYKEKVSWRAAIGAAIAVAGVAILFNA
jgi:drug/metabolite transporter (DMT)-like permease